LELGIGPKDVTDEVLRARLEEFVAVSSKNLRQKINKYSENIKYQSRLVNHNHRLMDSMECFENEVGVLGDRNGKKEWRR
jgi:hypothetical protein